MRKGGCKPDPIEQPDQIQPAQSWNQSKTTSQGRAWVEAQCLNNFVVSKPEAIGGDLLEQFGLGTGPPGQSQDGHRRRVRTDYGKQSLLCRSLENRRREQIP